MNLNELSAQIIEAERNEKLAREHRQRLQAEMASLLGVADNDEGVHHFDHLEGDYKVTVTCRISRKVDADKLQELAREAGLFDHLQSLFRWKPSIDMRAWKAADQSITAPLMSAITSKPGTPAVKITKKEQ